MFIIELNYKKPLSEVNKFLDEHRFFLDKYYNQGVFIASGPKIPRNGGIIISQASEETIENIIKNDPFYRENIADYRIIEFIPNKCNQEFEVIAKKNSWIK